MRLQFWSSGKDNRGLGFARVLRPAKSLGKSGDAGVRSSEGKGAKLVTEPFLYGILRVHQNADRRESFVR